MPEDMLNPNAELALRLAANRTNSADSGEVVVAEARRFYQFLINPDASEAS